MSEIETEEVTEFSEEVETELLEIALEEHEGDDGEETVLPEVDRDSVVEEQEEQVVENGHSD